MKKIITILILFSFVAINAQEEKEVKKETKEERKQRYINEGNPFKKYGYTPKIATLSKGKYREFFVDTIIKIGSFEYNRVSKEITGFTLYNKENLSEADLQPELVSRWMSPDPLSDEFPSWSPYNFVKNNPIRYIDPEGLAPEDVIITGKYSKEAFSQLQASVKGQLTLTMNDKGKVSALINEGVTLENGGASQTLLDAVNATGITVNLNTTDSFKTADGADFIGGAFRGSSEKDGNVIANQTINPDVLGKLDKFYERGQGVGVLHETIEGYIGAIDSPGSTSGTTGNKKGLENYKKAHSKAGQIDKRYSENTGKGQIYYRSGSTGRGTIRRTKYYGATKSGKSIILGKGKSTYRKKNR